MIHLRKFILVPVLFSLFACSQPAAAPIEATASFTHYRGGTETAVAVLTEVSPLATPIFLPTVSFAATPDPFLPTAEPISYPSVTPSATPITSLTPTTTPTAAVLPADFSPVLLGKKYDADTFFILLGGVQGGSWLSTDQAAARMPGAQEYDVYAFSSGPHPVYGYAPEKSLPYNEYFLSTDVTLNEVGMIGVAHGWQVTRRQPEELIAENELYQQVVMDWLSQAGVIDPQPATVHIYRIDLEGDGSDEIFINSTRVESQHTTRAGDHSIILMRKVIGNSAVTIPILADLYASVGYGNPFPCTYSISNFLDLNQDGILEVVVDFERWEGFGASVYEVHGTTVQAALGSTCMTP